MRVRVEDDIEVYGADAVGLSPVGYCSGVGEQSARLVYREAQFGSNSVLRLLD